MKRNLILLGLLGLWLILGISCGYVVAPTVIATPYAPINWWNSWLTQPICQPPCWQNITPGITTMKEALLILENTPDLTITFKTEDAVEWVFNQNKGEGGWLSISPNGKVAWLVNSTDRNLFFEKIVLSYSYPKYVKPYDCREGMCSTVLVYPDLGMLLSVFIENIGQTTNPNIKILPDTVVNRVYFIEPGMESFQNSLEFQEYDLLMEWKGYGEYP